MKKILTILIIISFVVVTSSCSRRETEKTIVNIYKDVERENLEIDDNNDIKSISQVPVLKIEKENEIKQIENTIENSILITEIIEMGEATYIINSSNKYYYLWLTSDSETALILKPSTIDNSTYYRCSREDTNKLKDIILEDN